MSLNTLVKKILGKSKHNNHQLLSSMAAVSKQFLLQRNLDSSESIVSDVLNTTDSVTVSLTTYSSRIFDVYLTIESISNQSVKPARVILWLDEDEFEKNELPSSLTRLQQRGLEIGFCPNYKSYKKLLPTLELYPQDHIITIDDDVMYPPDFIERFISEFNKNPDVVLCNHAHDILIKGGVIQPYRNWDHGTDNLNISKRILPVGVGGVFYPRGTFDGQSMSYSLIEELAPSTDDLWFKCMALQNGFRARKLRTKVDFESNFIQIPGSQVVSLFQDNLGSHRNDKQLSSICEYFKLSFQ